MTGTKAIGSVLYNESIEGTVYKMILYAPAIAELAVPGAFVHFGLMQDSSHILRRPISLAGCDAKKGTITIIYRLVGAGTRIMSTLPVGAKLDCLGPLGNGFTVSNRPAVLIGGGIGMAPLLFLASHLEKEHTTVIVGGKTASELFWRNMFDVKQILTTTDDGTEGRKGFAVDILADTVRATGAAMIYACGPMPMVKKTASIAAALKIPCEVSLEAYMGCGTGGCLGCAVDGRGGKRYKVCHDGPVFPAEEVFFRA